VIEDRDFKYGRQVNGSKCYAMNGKLSLKGAWLGHWTILILVGINHISETADCFRCYQLRNKLMTVSVTSLSYWPSTSVYNTVGPNHRVVRVCQRQLRLVYFSVRLQLQLLFFSAIAVIYHTCRYVWLYRLLIVFCPFGFCVFVRL